MDGKGSSSPISGLRASSIDLETHLAGRSAETRRARQHRTEERYYLCQAIFQYRSATLAAVRIAGERMYLWRAVDDEGEVLDMLVQRRRDTRSASASREWERTSISSAPVASLVPSTTA